MAAFPSVSQSLNHNTILGQHVNISTTVHQVQAVSSRPDPIDVLQSKVAFGALYNSDERYDPPKCHPQTRTAILDRIERWVNDTSSDANPILWLTGPAGAGKSANAQTLVEEWKQKDLITLAFFFWRSSPKRNSKAPLVPTIAFQLLEAFPSIKPEIEAAINPGGLFERRLLFQLEKLMVKPLHDMPHKQHPVVIVIDGLDECCASLPGNDDSSGQSYELQQQEILEAFSVACQRTPRLRLLIASRPERQIRELFGNGFLKENTSVISLKDAKDASIDIRLFLDCEFQEIRQRHGIDSSWPSEAQLSELVQKSSGQFIYPSIAIKHITRARSTPKQSLMSVLELQPGLPDNPLAELDMLYTLILKSVLPGSLPVVTNIIGYLLPYQTEPSSQKISRIFSPQPVDESLHMFEQFLFLSEGEASSHLTDLHSVIDVPKSPHAPIRMMHATFSEYLQDHSRSNDFFIGKEHISVNYVELLLRHLQNWNPSQKTGMYHKDDLIACICLWIDECPPSKRLMFPLWSLMAVIVGHYPFAGSNTSAGLHRHACKQLSALFVAEIKQFGNLWIQDLLIYLRKCNIPEIEPSWWCRLVVRWRLEAALSKFTSR